MQCLAGGALLLVVGLLTGQEMRLDWGATSLASVLALGYLIVFGSLLGFSAYTWLLGDRKSTRLNSSHSQISYAVFCLKKKKSKTSGLSTKHTQRTTPN